MELPRDCEGCMSIVNRPDDPPCQIDNAETYFRRLILDDELPTCYFLLRIPYTDWLIPSCLDGITYILKQQELMDLSAETAYLAIMFLTQYLRKANYYSDELTHQDQVKLVSITCLVLAVKQEGRLNLVMAVEWGEGENKFRTTDYCTDNHTFSAQEICDMEIVILHKLDHKMRFTTPFDYSHYFAKKFLFYMPQGYVVDKIEDTILTALRLNSKSALELMRQRSSVVALEAIFHFVAVDTGLLREEIAHNMRYQAIDIGLDVEAPAELLAVMEELPDSRKSVARKWLIYWYGQMPIVNAENDPLCPNEHGVDNDDEYIRRLIREEFPSNYGLLRFTQYDWIKPSCSDGIDYILNTKELFDLLPETVYLAIMYLTQYLSKVVFTEDSNYEVKAVKLISVTCLVLAAKWESQSNRVLAEENRKLRTTDFCIESYTFSAEEILEMEVMILRELDHKMGLTTPFHYVHYFCKKIYPHYLQQRAAVSRLEDTILCALHLSSESPLLLMRQRSSVVAMAAIIHWISKDNQQTRHQTTEDLRPLAKEVNLDIDDTPEVLMLLMELEAVQVDALVRRMMLNEATVS